MAELQHPIPLPSPSPPTFLESVAADRVRVLRDAAIVSALLIGATFLIPNVYTARAVLLPPSAETDMGGLLSSIPGSVALSRALGLDHGSEASLYLGVMRSAGIRDSLIARFALERVYRVANAEKARRRLARNTSLLLTNDGFVEVAVTDRVPRRAADLANSYVELLDRFLQDNANSGAGRRRQFLEKRLAATLEDLAASEDRLRDYQVRHRMPIVGADADRAGSAAAGLMAEKLSREVELGTLESVSLGPNARAEQLRNELRQIDAELAKIPPATTVLARLIRDVRIQEKVLLVLREEFERARVLELRNIPTVQVVDRATSPLEKSGPRRALMAVAIVMVALVMRALLSWLRARSLRSA